MSTNASNLSMKELSRRGFTISIWPGMERELDLLAHEIFDKNPYTRHGIAIRDGDCVVDLGANMGLFSLWCTTQAGNLQIYACEPLPPLFALSQLNLGRVKDHTIHVEEVGVGLKAAEHTFSYFPKATACSTMHGQDTREKMPVLYSQTKIVLRDLWSINKAAFVFALCCGPLLPLIRPLAVRTVLKRALSVEQRFRCQVRTLSQLIDGWGLEHIDLLKLDVQGAEADILLGIRDDHWRSISQVALEVNTFLGASAETDIVALLRHKGFEVIREDSPEIAAPGSHFVYAKKL